MQVTGAPTDDQDQAAMQRPDTCLAIRPGLAGRGGVLCQDRLSRVHAERCGREQACGPAARDERYRGCHHDDI